MRIVQLQEFALHHACRILAAGNQDILLPAQYGFQDQVYNAVDQLPVMRIHNNQAVIVNVFPDQFPVCVRDVIRLCVMGSGTSIQS